MSRTEKIIFGILIAAILLLIFMIVRSIKTKKEDHIYEKFAQTKMTYPRFPGYPEHPQHTISHASTTLNTPTQKAITVHDRLHRVLMNMQRQIYDNHNNSMHIFVRNMHVGAGIDTVEEAVEAGDTAETVDAYAAVADVDVDTAAADGGIEENAGNDTIGVDVSSESGFRTRQIIRNHDEFFDNIQRNNHNNDSQNVHNTQINVSLAKKYDRLYELHIQQNKDLYDALPNLELIFDDIQEMKIISTMREIRQFAEAHISSKYTDVNNVEQMKYASTEREKIMCVLNEIQKGNTITSISNAVDENGSRIPISEDWILTLAWEHIHSHDNIPVLKNLQEALYDQLIDATYTFSSGSIADDILRLFFGNNFTNGGNTTRVVIQPVCINGRVGRILSAFTLIDTDPILAEPEKDDKEIANEAYTKANHILEEELSTFTINIPEYPETSIRDLYSKDDSDLTDSERVIVTDFSNHVKKVVAETLHKEYKHLIDEKLLVTIVNNSVSVM